VPAFALPSPRTKLRGGPAGPGPTPLARCIGRTLANIGHQGADPTAGPMSDHPG